LTEAVDSQPWRRERTKTLSESADAAAYLEQRIARLEAIEEIKRLKYRYWRACDSKDPEAFRDCFVTSAADLDYGVLGIFHDRDALVDVYAGLALRRENGRWLYNDIHHGIHPDIEVQPDGSATGRWTFWFMRVDLLDNIVVQQSMEYDDRYVMENGRWLIQKSHVRALTGVAVPLAADAVVAPGPPERIAR